MTRELLTLHLAHCFPVSFVEILKLSMRWSQILTHWNLSQKATVPQEQGFPTTASQPHWKKPCGCWSIKSSRVLVRSLISRTLGDLGRSRLHGNLKPCGRYKEQLSCHETSCLKTCKRHIFFLGTPATSSFSEREPSNAPILNYEHPRSACTEPCLLGAWKVLHPSQGFQSDGGWILGLKKILTGCGTKPPTCPEDHFSREEWLRTPWRCPVLRCGRSFHFLEHKEWKGDRFHLNENGSFWESFEVELEYQKPVCQRTETFEQVPISNAPTSRRPMMYLYSLYIETLKLKCKFQLVPGDSLWPFWVG